MELFRQEFDAYGPVQPHGISPQLAMSRLRTFGDKFARMEARMRTLANGETLFGLKATEYPELAQMKKELQLCDQLYSLYNDVMVAIQQFKDSSWRCVT